MCSKRRPAPEKSRSAAAAAATSAPIARHAVSAAAALSALWAPGTVSSTATPSSAKVEPPGVSAGAASNGHSRRPVAGQRQQLRAIPHHRVLRRGEELAERRLDVAPRAVGRVVVELGVGEHGDAAVEAAAASGRTRRPRPRATRPSPSRRSSPSSGPRRRPGSPGRGPLPRSAWTSMLDVVVLPWVPETAIVGRSRVSSPSSSARCSSRWRAGARSRARGSRAGSRSSTTTSAPSRHVGGVVALDRLDPGGAQPRGVGGAARAVRARHRRRRARARRARARSSPRRRCPRSAGCALTTPSPWRGRLRPQWRYQRLPEESGAGSAAALARVRAAARDVARPRRARSSTCRRRRWPASRPRP